MNLYIILPVFNEEKNIVKLLQDLGSLHERVAPEFDCRIIIVDDGSTDRSVSRINENKRALNITLLSHRQNQGPGACFATAFSYLKDKLGSEDWVVTMEADNTSPIQTLMHMLVRRKEGYQVILASPYSYGGGFSEVSVLRLLVSHIANALVKIALGIKGINTFSSFFRLYSGNVLQKLYQCFGPAIVECEGFECMVELLYKLVLVKATISEVELKVDWSQRRGKSKMKLFKTTRGYLKIFLKRKKWAAMIAKH